MKRTVYLILFLTICYLHSWADNTSLSTNEVLNRANELFDSGGKRDEAFSMLMDAFRRADDAGDRMSCARILQKYASFLWLDNGSASGVGVFLCALSYCPEKEIKLRILITQGIGQSYCELGQYELSEKYLQESLELSEQIGYEYGVIMALHNLGVLYQENKDYAKAVDVNKRGIEASRRKGDKYMEGAFYINLGNVVHAYQDKLYNITRGIEIEDSVGAKNVVLYAWYNLAEAQLQATMYDEAIQSAKNALSYSDYVDESDLILENTYSLLAEIYAAQKDYNSAFHYNELFRTVKANSDTKLKIRSGTFINDIREIERRTNDFLKYSYWSEINWWNVISIGALLIVILIAIVVFARLKVYKLYTISSQRVKETEKEYQLIRQQYAEYQANAECDSAESERVISELVEQNKMLAVFKDSRNILLKKIAEMIKGVSDTVSIAEQAKLKNIIQFINHSIITPSTKEAQAQPPMPEAAKDAKDFKERLLERFPGLSANEQQLCEYFQMGLNTREISQLSGKPVKTVNMARYRLRKSLQLSPEEDLTQFLKSI